MAKPLRDLVAEKTGHYGTSRTGIDSLSLLVVYNIAVLYNSPAETPLHSFDGAVDELKQLVARSRGPFDHVYLFIAPTPGRRVLRVC